MAKRQEAVPEPKPPQEPAYLVRWKCRECPRTQAGWIREFDNEPRFCKGIPLRDTGSREEPEVCGCLMDVVHDERPYRMSARSAAQGRQQ